MKRQFWRSAKLFKSVLYWTWKKHDGVAAWTFRLLTLISFGYLIYDRIFETSATISSVASDPNNPFYFPFSITNNSHIFTLRDIQWTCAVVSAKTNNITLTNVSFGFTDHASEILPGDVLNISCKRAIVGLPPVTQLVMSIDVVYDTKLLGIYSLTRCPKTLFTWTADASNPQWIRGPFTGEDTKTFPVQEERCQRR
jgi:hypothetical protein